MPARVKYPRLPGESRPCWVARRARLAKAAFLDRNPNYGVEHRLWLRTELGPLRARQKEELRCLRLRHEVERAELRRYLVRMNRQNRAHE